MEEQPENSTFNFLRTVLLGLCANFNEMYLPENDWECVFQHEYYYKLRSLKGKTLRFTTVEKPPLSGAVKDENGGYKGTGLAFDLVHEIQKKAGFYYNITLPQDNYIGGESGGILEILKNKEADLAVAFVPIMHKLENVISYSTSLAEFEWVLFMARPSASASGAGLLAPFQKEVWCLILFALIIAGLGMYLIVYLRFSFGKVDKEVSLRNKKPYTLDTCFWFVYGALMKQGSALTPAYDSSRVFFATWWIFITILTSFYTANLTAFLTLYQFSLSIQSTKDIFLNHKKWMADKGGYEESLIVNENAFDYLKATIPHYGRYTSESLKERLKKIAKGEIYLTEKRRATEIMINYYTNRTKKNIVEGKRCKFVLAPKSVLARPVGFAYRKDSEIRELFDPILKYFVQSGIVAHLLQESFPISSICPLNLNNRDRKLLNSDLKTTYYAVLIGLGMSVIAFLGEIIYRYYHNFKRKKTKSKSKSRKTFSKKPEPFKDNIFPINNKVTFGKENMTNSTTSDNFIISYYYKEIMPPLNNNENYKNPRKKTELIMPGRIYKYIK